MDLNILDYVLLGIIGLSTLAALYRGFIRELIDLVGLIIAFYVAQHFAADIGAWLQQWIHEPQLATTGGFILGFVATLILTAILGALLAGLINLTSLSVGCIGTLEHWTGCGKN